MYAVKKAIAFVALLTLVLTAADAQVYDTTTGQQVVKCPTCSGSGGGAVTQSGTWTMQAGQTTACTNFIPISQTATTDVYTSTAKVHFCAIVLVSAAQQGWSLAEGTGSNCASGESFLAGGAGGTMQLAANGGFSAVSGFSFLQSKTAADHICLIQSGSANISGFMSYSDN